MITDLGIACPEFVEGFHRYASFQPFQSFQITRLVPDVSQLRLVPIVPDVPIVPSFRPEPLSSHIVNQVPWRELARFRNSENMKMKGLLAPDLKSLLRPIHHDASTAGQLLRCRGHIDAIVGETHPERAPFDRSEPAKPAVATTGHQTGIRKLSSSGFPVNNMK
jgi:hypothetical protein